MTERLDVLAVLGCTAAEAEDWLRGRRVTPGEVEAAAARHYRWRSHLRDDTSYWVTIGQAAQILGRSRAEVAHMVQTRRLPSIRHVSGTRLLRRDRVLAMLGEPSMVGEHASVSTG